jgi:hypothetical protein
VIVGSGGVRLCGTFGMCWYGGRWACLAERASIQECKLQPSNDTEMHMEFSYTTTIYLPLPLPISLPFPFFSSLTYSMSFSQKPKLVQLPLPMSTENMPKVLSAICTRSNKRRKQGDLTSSRD